VNSALKCVYLVMALGVAIHADAAGLTSQAPACDLSLRTVGNLGYVGCLGSFEGNMDNQLSDIWSTMVGAGNSWGTVAQSQAYVSSESFSAAMNPFSQNEGANDDGTINFDAPQGGLFALGLKQGNGFSLYLFDGTTVKGGISSIAYDTNGVKAAKSQSFGLSHAGFFGTVSPVPEPSTYAMMLAGLAVVGFTLRRRQG
jgi:hypothetical protein